MFHSLENKKTLMNNKKIEHERVENEIEESQHRNLV